MFGDNWFETTTDIITVITVVLQVYVIFLINKKSPTNMEEYTFFLNMVVIYDLLFTASFGLGWGPGVTTHITGTVVHGLFQYLGLHFCLIMAGFVFYLGASVIAAQDYSLMYRYVVVHNNRRYHQVFMSKSFKTCFIILTQFIAIGLGVIYYLLLVHPRDVFDYVGVLRSHGKTIPDFRPDEVIIIIKIEIPLFRAFTSVFLTLFALSEIFCILLLIMTFSKLRENVSKFSKNTYRLHIQFTVLLGAQFLTPLVLIFGPIALFTVEMLTDVTFIELVTQIGLIGLLVYGLTNQLLTIVFVGPYRQHSYETFIKPLMHLVLTRWRPARSTTREIIAISPMPPPRAFVMAPIVLRDIRRPTIN